jgi:predicted HTH domain antitoxin
MANTDTLTIPVTLPREFIALLGAPAQATETAREYIILGLFQEARISGGKAAELLGLTRESFIALLARKGIPYFRLAPQEWEAELARIRESDAIK